TTVVSSRGEQPIAKTAKRMFVINNDLIDNAAMRLNADDTSPVIGTHNEVLTPLPSFSPAITEEKTAPSGRKETTIASIDQQEQPKTASGDGNSASRSIHLLRQINPTLLPVY